MRRQLASTLIVASLVLAVSLSLTIAPAAIGCGTGKVNVLSKLNALRNDFLELSDCAFKNSCSASHYRGVLANKIEVVNDMVEVGAHDEAAYKLEKDVKKLAEHWVTEDDVNRIIEEIDDIINLLGKLQPTDPPHFPDFAVTAFPKSLTVEQGSTNSSTIMVISLNGLDKPVSLAVVTSSPISGVVISLSPWQVFPSKNDYASSILIFEAAENASIGAYSITVSGTSEHLKHSVEVQLKIIPSPSPPPAFDFNITANPLSLKVQQGRSNVSLIVITSLTSASQLVDLAVTLRPINEIRTVINPLQVIPPSNNSAISLLTVETDVTAPLGDYTINLTGTSGNLMHSVNISLTVTGPPPQQLPDFSLIVSPSSLKLQQEGLGASDIVVISLKGFDQPVSLTVTPVAGTILVTEPRQVTPPPNGTASSVLTISPFAAIIPGKYVITVTGISGNLRHDANMLLEVTTEIEAPQIVSVLRLPKNPAYNDSVTVLALVTDVGSGVSGTVLTYLNSTIWVNTTMTLKEGLYSASIPAFAYSTVVKYRVYAYDWAGNQAMSDLDSYAVSDPYAPVIADPSWIPKEPDANVNIAVNSDVTEPTGSSGVQNVTLQSRNDTGDWTFVPMRFADGTWTALLTNQSDTSIDFKIKAFDYAGNSAETKLYQIQVKVLTSLPLSLISLVTIILAALAGSAIYFLWGRRHKGKAAVGSSETALPSLPAGAGRPASLIMGYEMVSFVVPARNEGNTISQRIAAVYERAVNHVGPSEIIVVDDGSADNTYEAAWSAIESNRRKWPNIRNKVIRLSSTLGKEEAIRFGRSKATGEIVETVDG